MCLCLFVNVHVRVLGEGVVGGVVDECVGVHFSDCVLFSDCVRVCVH